MSTAPWGLLAEYDRAAAVFSACEQVRDAGYQRWDAHTPYPVHNLDRAMGQRPSRVPWISLGAAVTTGCAAMGLQWWTSAVDYPYLIAGKPFFSWPAFVPVTFALTVLLGVFGALAGVLHFCRLPRHHHPLFSSSRFERASDDRFFISIEASDPRFELARTRALLEATGALHVEEVRDDDGATDARHEVAS